MRLLLDTHILLWALSNDARLPVKARKMIENEENKIYYSIVSLWEAEIKHLLHPNVMSVSAEALSGYCLQSGYQELLIRGKHIFTLSGLKREEKAQPHKDPFDRMLICQALVENMLFITHDALISGYEVPNILLV